MFNYQEKSEKVEALQLRRCIMYYLTTEGAYEKLDEGSWIVNCKHGQVLMTDTEFKRRYEPIPKNDQLRYDANS